MYILYSSNVMSCVWDCVKLQSKLCTLCFVGWVYHYTLSSKFCTVRCGNEHFTLLNELCRYGRHVAWAKVGLEIVHVLGDCACAWRLSTCLEIVHVLGDLHVLGDCPRARRLCTCCK